MQPVFDHPPASMQSLQELRECYSWLYRLSEQLNVAIAETDTKIASTVREQVTSTTSASSPAAAIAQTARDLRTLIIKNANVVERYRDEIYQELRETYLAKSDFGTMRADITREIQDSATGTFNRFIHSEEYTDVADSVDGLENAVNLLNNYRIDSDSYIQSGLLYYDENGMPVYGVAIGDKLKRITDGSGASVLDRTDITCTITSDRISFGMGGREVAYLSNSILYITSAQILSTFTLGNLVATVQSSGIDWRWR